MEEIKIKKVNNYMAMLRNLRNIDKAGVSDEHIAKVCAGLEHAPAIMTSKQLPFRFWSAYKSLRSASSDTRLIDSVENALNASIANLPKLDGKVMALCDNSGSAHGTLQSKYGSVRVSEIANLTAVLTGMVAEHGEVGIFGDKLKTMKIDPTGSVLQQAEKVNKIGNGIGQGTETGIWLFWDNAIKNKKHYDHVFVYSDMQAGHGGLYTNSANTPTKPFRWKNENSRHVDVPNLIKHYREKVNPDVKVYLVQVAGYGDALIPEAYDKTYILGGWSDGIIRFADKMNKITNK